MKGLSRKSWNLIAARLPHLLVAIAAVGGILLGQSTRKPSQIGCASSPGCGIANDPWTIGTAGPENAPLTVIIFSDFQSFLCGRTAHVLVDTLGESKDIRLIFKHLPKNDEALLAHEAANRRWCTGQVLGNAQHWGNVDSFHAGAILAH
jgi:hypothetical protein